MTSQNFSKKSLIFLKLFRNAYSGFLRNIYPWTTAAPQISAPPTGAVISAPPSRPVVKDDEDVLATLQKYEKQVKEDTRCVVERLAISLIQKK